MNSVPLTRKRSTPYLVKAGLVKVGLIKNRLIKAGLLTAGLAGALAFSALAEAREVTVATQLSQYRGDGAYVAVYLTDARGSYQKTLWVAGKKSKYFKHLKDWARGSNRSSSEYDGITGASITRGETLKITVDLDDALIDSGYQIRVDTAVEDKRDNPADLIAPLTTEGMGKPVSGSGYVQALTYRF